MDVIHIAGLGTMWLGVEVYENQLPWIREGSTVRFSISDDQPVWEELEI